MRHGKKIIFLILFFPLRLLAQDITGLWQGSLYNDTTQQYYRYEIGISQDKKGKYSGYSHTWFLLDDKQYYGVKKLKIRKASDGKIIVEDDGLIANNYPVSPAKHVRQLNVLSFTSTDNEMILSGPFSTNRTKEYSSLTGIVEVRRKNNFRQSALVPHLQELGLDEQLSFVKEENDNLATIENNVNTKKETEQKNTLVKTEADKKAKEAEVALIKKQADEKAKLEKEAIVRAEVEERKKLLAAAEEKKQKDAAKKTALAKAEKIQKEKEQAALIKANEAEKAAKAATTLAAKQEAARLKSIAVEEKRQLDIQKKTSDSLVLVSKLKKAAEENEAKLIAASIARQKEIEAKKNVLTTQETRNTLPAQNPPVTTITTAIAAADVTKRKTILQQTVSFKTDSLQLALYDNGEVDGDTVSILMNGKLIMARQGLSTNAIRKTIYIDPAADSVELVMYAENLGSIAPNTGLLVVRDGKDLYEIRFSGDLQKNASIIFRRKK